MSNNNAATTRKRRSSILKTKPRAPFSELEFNPATPDATAKSRRVSFSRKKDVAEFVVNEATTTWRNFYEEQNRSLESSANESGIRPQAVKFHEVEAEIDPITLGNPAASRGPNLTMFSDMNFTEQLASLDCMTANNTMKAPIQSYELVKVTGEKSSVFAESFVNPVILEQTGRIEVDFSMIQPSRPDYDEHDLSDMVKDVENSIPKVNAQSSFRNDFNNRSFYTEVDLNETKGVVRTDISDMSITDTIQAPLAQNTAKSFDIVTSKESSLDWIIDKENRVVESFSKPPVEQCLSRNDENVLVFDGKKLKVANVNDKLDDILNESLPAKKLTTDRNKLGSRVLDLSNTLNQLTNDVLGCHPLTADEQVYTANVSKINLFESQTEKNTEIESQVSMPRLLDCHQMSLVMDQCSIENCIDNPSINITNKIPGLPSLLENSLNIEDVDKPGSIINHAHQEQAPIQSVSNEVAANKISHTNHTEVFGFDSKSCSATGTNEDNEINYPIENTRKPLYQHENSKEMPKRKTIVLNHNDDLPNFTLDVPPQFDHGTLQGQKSVVFDTEDSVVSMSTTQAILREIQEASNLFTYKNTSKPNESVFNKDDTLADLSMTKPVPAANIVKDKSKNNIISDTDNGLENKTLKPNLILPSENKRQTNNFNEDNWADFSLTQAMKSKENRKTINEMAEMSITQAIPSKLADNKNRKTIVFVENDALANMSMTQAIPSQYLDMVMPHKSDKMAANNKQTEQFEHVNDLDDKPLTPLISSQQNRKSLHGIADMSMTKAITSIQHPTRPTMFSDADNNLADLSITEAIPSAKCTVQDKSKTFNNVTEMSMTQSLQIKRNTAVVDKDKLADFSLTQALPTQQKRKTINEMADMSMTQAVPQIYTNQGFKKQQSIVFDMENDIAANCINQDKPNNISDMSIIQAMQQVKSVCLFDNKDRLANLSLAQTIDTQQKRKTIHEVADMSITQAIPQLLTSQVSKRQQTIVFEDDNDLSDLSMTKVVSTSVIKDKYKIINDMTNMSITYNEDRFSQAQTIPIQQKRKTINEVADMSMTEAIPQIVATQSSENESNLADFSVLKTLPTQQNRKTINELADMSITQAIPQILKSELFQKQPTVLDMDSDLTDLSVINSVGTANCINQHKRKTINNITDMSITQAAQQVTSEHKREPDVFDNNVGLANLPLAQTTGTQQKRKTIHEVADMSITQAIPQLLTSEVFKEQQSIVFGKDNDLSELSTSKLNVIQEKRKTADTLIIEAVKQVDSMPEKQVVFNDHGKLADRLSLQSSQQNHKTIHEIQNKKQYCFVKDKNVTTTQETKINSECHDKLKKTNNEENSIITLTKTLEQKHASMLDNESNSVTTMLEKSQNLRKSTNFEKINMSMTQATDQKKSSNLIHSNQSDGLNKQNKIIPKAAVNEAEDPTTVFDQCNDDKRSVLVQERISENDLITDRDVKLVHNMQKIQQIQNVVENPNIMAVGDMRNTLHSQMVNISDSESNLKIVADKSLENVYHFDAIQKVSSDNHDVNKIVSQSLQVGQHDVEGGLGEEGAERQAIKDGSVKIKDSNNSAGNKEDFSLKRQAYQIPVNIKNNNTSSDNPHVQPLNDTNEIINMLTEVTDEMDQNLLQSGKKICPTDSQKTLTEEDLDMISDETDLNDQEYKKKGFEKIDIIAQSDKDVVQQKDKEKKPGNSGKKKNNKKNSMAERLEQTETLKYLNKTMEKKMRGKDVPRNMGMHLNDAQKPQIEDFEMEPSMEDRRYKPIRLSREVVKTLNFEDENSINQEIITEPDHVNSCIVKKSNSKCDISTKFAANSSRVIPDFYEVTMDNIKDLMQDLVKPNADLPFSSDLFSKQEDVSKVSAPLQCNVDISDTKPEIEIARKTEHQSEITGNFAEKKFHFESVVEPVLQNNTMTGHFRNAFVIENNKSIPKAAEETNSTNVSELGKTIIFDNRNPLNNIDLASVTYKVDKSSVRDMSDRRFDVSNPLNNICLDVETLATKTITNERTEERINSTINGIITESSTNKAESGEQSNKESKIDNIDDANDSIHSKEIEDISCIALVDNTLENSDSELVMEMVTDKPVVQSKTDKKRPIFPKQNIDVLYMITKDHFDASDTADEESKTDQKCTDLDCKTRKRVLTPRKHNKHKDCTLDKLDLTPNPPRKIHKISNSPTTTNTYDVELDKETSTIQSTHIKTSIPATDLHDAPKGDTATLNSSPIQLVTIPTCKNSWVVRSPKEDESIIIQHESDLDDSKTCVAKAVMATETGRRWRGESADSEMCVRGEREDVVGLIDELPFMGSWCCEWECAEAESWSFLLLHARIRLRVAFDRAGDDPRTYVSPQTAVRKTQVDVIKSEKSHAVAALCIRACSEALRSAAGGCGSAAEVPALLTRCARVVRDAARFGRAMQHASMHLAYRLSGDVVTMQVANIPLRSIWEVSLRVACGARADGPRALEVRVTPVCASGGVREGDVRAALADVQDGWGHVPETIWKIFKHLKDKRKDQVNWRSYDECA